MSQTLVHDDALTLGPLTLSSRLITGTGKFPSPDVMRRALKESGTEMVTVAIRRTDLDNRWSATLQGALIDGGDRHLPNPAG